MKHEAVRKISEYTKICAVCEAFASACGMPLWINNCVVRELLVNASTIVLCVKCWLAGSRLRSA